MIDLSAMKGVHVDPTARTVRAQAGATWGEVAMAQVLYPFLETCQNVSWSRHLAEATLTHGLSLPVAVPVAADGGLTWVSSGLVYRPAATRLGRDLIRQAGEVQRGVVVPVEPGAAGVAHELPRARVSLALTAPHAEHVLELGYHRLATTYDPNGLFAAAANRP